MPCSVALIIHWNSLPPVRPERAHATDIASVVHCSEVPYGLAFGIKHDCESSKSFSKVSTYAILELVVTLNI
jgi:hypothetical protein